MLHYISLIKYEFIELSNVYNKSNKKKDCHILCQAVCEALPHCLLEQTLQRWATLPWAQFLHRRALPLMLSTSLPILSTGNTVYHLTSRNNAQTKELLGEVMCLLESKSSKDQRIKLLPCFIEKPDFNLSWLFLYHPEKHLNFSEMYQVHIVL